MKLKGIFILVIALLSIDKKVPAPDNQIFKGVEFFEGSWKELKEKAGEENLPIFVDAYAAWCKPCKWMKNNVFTNWRMGLYYNRNFINYRFDMETKAGKRFADKYVIKNYPTLLYFDEEGDLIHKAEGAKNVNEMLKISRGVMNAFKEEGE